ncbi:hypothetical protein [uncultured Algibacter sp.]|uniref:hypothetical protein n=1 Tax=uncultured Algibacter sp. TaxID=298659 RepID=UPI002633614D|nr:hypothetical protein [uncultured Algibacter sp.]
MEALNTNSKPHLILFWSVPSISMVKEYKAKCELLSQAIRNLKSVEILTYENKILKLEQIVIDSGKFFGMENIKGEFKKLLLNVNKIKKIIIL